MNEVITAQAANMITLLAGRIPEAREEITELIRTSMAFAFAEGELQGLRQAQAVVQTTQAISKMRREA